MQLKSRKGEEILSHMELTRHQNYSSPLAPYTPWQCIYISSTWGLTYIRHQRSRTIATEKIIEQLQGKANQIQSLDTSPTYADTINKTKDLSFVTEALSELSTY